MTLLDRPDVKAVLILAAFVAIAAVLLYLFDPTPTPPETIGACERHLGAAWQNAGLIDAPGLDHYDVTVRANP